MDFNALKYYYFVVKEGSFSAAARKLFVSQSAISQQVRKLEGEFSKKIFEKTLPKIELTKFGNELFRSACQLFEKTPYFYENELSLWGGKEIVTIGMTTFLGSFYLEKILSKIFQRFPKMKVEVVLDSYPNLVAKLLQKEIFFFYSGNYTINDPTLVGYLLEEIPFGFVTPAKVLKFSDLKNYPYIKSRENHLGENHEIMSFVRRKFDIVSHTSSLMLKPLIMQGEGFKYLPYFYFAEEINTGEMNLWINEALEHRKIYSQLVYRRASQEDKKLHFFIDLFQEYRIKNIEIKIMPDRIFKR